MKMDIKEQQIKIKDLVEGYVNNDEEGVIGYGGKTVIDVDQKKNNGRMIHKDENRRLG